MTQALNPNHTLYMPGTTKRQPELQRGSDPEPCTPQPKILNRRLHGFGA